MTQTLTRSETDLEKEGRHNGLLLVPRSVHRSAFGGIPVPIVRIKSGAGTADRLMAGVRGDDREGQIALTKLCGDLNGGDITEGALSS